MRLILWLLCGMVALSVLCNAQNNRATLSGTVTDQSGATVANAKVAAVQAGTNFKFNTTANESGTYAFIGLPIGEYEVVCEQDGFQRVVRQGVILSASKDVRVDLSLTVGKVSDTIEVKAEGALVEQRSSTYGNALDAKAIQDLPLAVSGHSRGVYSLLAAVPGVTQQGFGNNVFGGVGLSTQILVDGLGAEYASTAPGVQERPQSVESIDEFQVVQANSAEYGLSGGGVINVTTKSGTNSFHGSAFEYMRNEALDAAPFFAKKRPLDKEHEYGFTLGGPIRRNKTFFWGEFDYFRTASSQGGNGSAASGALLTLPTSPMMSGDFSALLGAQTGTDILGRPILAGQIYDPSTTRVVSGQTVRDPFPGNIIPSDRISPISQTIQSYFPPLTSPDQIVNNFIGPSGNTIRDPDYSIKVTQMLGQGALDVSQRVVIHNQDNTYPLPGVLSTWNNYNQHNYATRIAYTLPLGTRMTASFLMGLDRQAGLGYHSAGLQSTFGIQGLFSNDCSTNVNIAQMVFTSPPSASLGDGFCDYNNRTTNWKYSGNLTRVSGKHAVKFGGNYFRWLQNLHYRQGSQGSFSFTPQTTGQPGDSLAKTGFGYASFLLGLPYSASVTPNQSKQMGEWEFGLFVQDEYRITPRLTLSGGVRYDYQPQYTVPGNYQSQFDPTIPNPGAGGLLGAINFAGNGPGRCNCSRWSSTYPWGFAPRFGFAYKLNTNTVVRGSYGLYWQQVSQYSGEGQAQYGILPSSALADLDAGITPVLNWENGYPAFSLEPNLDPAVQNHRSVTFVGHDAAYPAQVQLVNLSLQHEFPGNVLFEAAYIRNVGHHLPTGAADQRNQIDYAQYGQLGNLLNEDVYSTDAVNAGITAPYPGFVGTVSQALRPYPQYLNVTNNNAKIGNSSYNALQVKVTKRFSSGLSFLVGYTLSKNLSDVGATATIGAAGVQNAYDRAAEYVVTPVDQRHAVVATYTYELPFGTGKRFISSTNSFSRYVVGGWKVSGIHNYATGTPIGVSTGQGLPTVASGIRANIVEGVDPNGSYNCSGSNPGLRFDAGAFAIPAPFTFGNAPPLFNNLRGCSSLNENFSLLKSFPVIKERVGIEFGVNFFNVLNRHAFSFSNNLGNINAFGTVTGASGPRRGQVNMRVTW